MHKDFDKWNKRKKHIHESRPLVDAHAREVWWCALGVNVGAETDGKHHHFERPVLVMRVYNRETLLVLPITSRKKNDDFHYKVQFEKGDVWIKLTQVRVVSSRRLLRKVDVLSEREFKDVKEMFRKFT